MSYRQLDNNLTLIWSIQMGLSESWITYALNSNQRSMNLSLITKQSWHNLMLKSLITTILEQHLMSFSMRKIKWVDRFDKSKMRMMVSISWFQLWNETLILVKLKFKICLLKLTLFKRTNKDWLLLQVTNYSKLLKTIREQLRIFQHFLDQNSVLLQLLSDQRRSTSIVLILQRLIKNKSSSLKIQKMRHEKKWCDQLKYQTIKVFHHILTDETLWMSKYRLQKL